MSRRDDYSLINTKPPACFRYDTDPSTMSIHKAVLLRLCGHSGRGGDYVTTSDDWPGFLLCRMWLTQWVWKCVRACKSSFVVFNRNALSSVVWSVCVCVSETCFPAMKADWPMCHKGISWALWKLTYLFVIPLWNVAPFKLKYLGIDQTWPVYWLLAQPLPSRT